MGFKMPLERKIKPVQQRNGVVGYPSTYPVSWEARNALKSEYP